MDVSVQIMKNVRRSLKLSQEDMARVLGVVWRTVNRWEAGQSKPGPLPSEMYLLLKRALRLGMDPEEIVTWSKTSVGRLRFFRKLGNAVVQARV